MCEYVSLKLELEECEHRHDNFMQRVRKWKLSEPTKAALRELDEQRNRHNEFLRAKMTQIVAQGENFEGLAKQIYYYKNVAGWTVADISMALNYSERQVNRIYKQAMN